MLELNKETSQAIQAQAQTLSEAIVTRQYELQPEIWEPYGQIGREKCIQDINYHLSYLAEAISVADPSLFANYIAWVKALFANLKLPETGLITALECTQAVLQEFLAPEMAPVIQEYIETGLQQLYQAPVTLSSFLDHQSTLSDLAKQYMEALLEGDRQRASRLILDAVNQGISVKDIYLYVFQPSQYEIGRLWQMNQVSVAQEHYCTAATQLIMSQLYPHIFATEKIGRRLVATCVGGELHEIGIRMVADFFEMEGWDTYYLGANTPLESITRTVIERQADALAISATMTFHINQVAALVGQVRASEAGQRVKIMVGGYPFNVSSNLWQRLQADGYAHDAQEAVAVANRLVSTHGN